MLFKREVSDIGRAGSDHQNRVCSFPVGSDKGFVQKMKIKYYGQMMFNLGILFYASQAISNARLKMFVLDQVNRVLNDLADMVGDGDIK